MTRTENPFEFEAANNLAPEQILDYYIEDFNFSRLLQSKRNIFVIGERGSGKTMTLLYNSWKLQNMKARRNRNEPRLGIIGIYIPCNTPLTHKQEYQLLGEFKASIISEHFLVLAITHAIADTLTEIPGLFENPEEEEEFRSELAYVLGADLPGEGSVFSSIQQFVQRQLLETQREINKKAESVDYTDTFSFSSLIVPILGSTRKIKRLNASHFSLMVDDAHSLNEFQIRTLNSWIAYRDHSLFSFKVAAAKITKRVLKTASGGSILENHDYFRIDLQQAFHNEYSNFGQLAKQLIARRLEKYKFESSPDDFFPVSPVMEKELEEAGRAVRRVALKKYGNHERKKVADYVYKHKRAYYFRSRPRRANRPQYSGFSTLVYISTGVIRNLLEPCYWMYDKMLSLLKDGQLGEQVITHVPPGIQAEIILERSRRLWDRLREGLDQEIEGCSRQDAVHAFQLMDNLAIHFRSRLLHQHSEPNANSFTISSLDKERFGELLHILVVLEKAQYIYSRSGAAKEKGKREIYYIPNRMLWPDRGLDPHGQHARVSLQAQILWLAAKENQEIPLLAEETSKQQELWDV